jgi:hypothetical protein
MYSPKMAFRKTFGSQDVKDRERLDEVQYK